MGLLSGILGNAATLEVAELQEKYVDMLTENEEIELGFQLIRDTFIFTNFRLILVDVQGLTGKKTEYMSVLYGEISRFSIETAGHLDLDAELKIWLGSADLPAISKKFNKEVNIYDVQKVLATHLIK